MEAIESSSGAICWPEQWPGEREAYLKWSRSMDQKYPGRKVDCCHWDTYAPCRHCQTCGKFLSNIQIAAYGWGVAAIYGTCKNHGLQYVDMTNWDVTLDE